MGAEKIVHLSFGPTLVGEPTPLQFELFGQVNRPFKTFCFVDIFELSQDRLIKSVMRSAIDTVVDLRAVPVFNQPDFDHRELTIWMDTYNVSYIEYAMAVYDPEGFAEIDKRYMKSQKRSKSSLWIYDSTSKEMGWLDRVKIALRQSGSFGAEISSRSLFHTAGVI